MGRGPVNRRLGHTFASVAICVEHVFKFVALGLPPLELWHRARSLKVAAIVLRMRLRGQIS